jgi:hypothetical protein
MQLSNPEQKERKMLKGRRMELEREATNGDSPVYGSRNVEGAD